MTLDRTLSTSDLRRRLTEGDTVVVDVRPLSRFNGWRLPGQVRSGHIPGAVSLPSSWLRLVDEAELLALLESKRIGAARSVVLYGDDAAETEEVRIALQQLGLQALVYGGWGEWLADPDLPVEKLLNYEKLVTPEWVA